MKAIRQHQKTKIYKIHEMTITTIKERIVDLTEELTGSRVLPGGSTRKNKEKLFELMKDLEKKVLKMNEDFEKLLLAEAKALTEDQEELLEALKEETKHYIDSEAMVTDQAIQEAWDDKYTTIICTLNTDEEISQLRGAFFDDSFEELQEYEDGNFG